MACMTAVFHLIGRFAVRYRWAVLAAWVAGSVLAVLLLPSLGSVTQSDNSSFLPASAPSQQSAILAAPLQGAASLTSVTVVVARPGRQAGSLDAADQAALAAMATRLERVPRVVSVRLPGGRVRRSGDGAGLR